MARQRGYLAHSLYMLHIKYVTMNKRYQDLQVTEGTYVPPVVVDYPEDDPYQGIYKPVYDRDFPEVDANYPYVDDSFKNKLLIEFGYHIVLRLLMLVLRVKYGLRWTGKEYLRRYKEQWTSNPDRNPRQIRCPVLSSHRVAQGAVPPLPCPGRL